MHRFIALFLSILISLGISTAQESAFISVEIKNPKGESLSISYTKDFISGAQERIKVRQQDGGIFEAEIPLEMAQVVYFSHARERGSMFIHPGAKVRVFLDTEQFDESLEFSGKGPSVIASNFMAKHFLTFQDEGPRQHFFDLLKKGSAEEFKEHMKEMKKNQLQFYNEFYATKDLDEAFNQYMINEINYDYGFSLLQFPGYASYLRGIAVHEIDLPADYYDFMGQLDLQNQAAIQSSAYGSYLEMAINQLMREEKGEENSEHAGDYIRYAADKLSGAPLSYVQYQKLTSTFRYGNPLEVVAEFEEFVAHPDHEAYASELREAYEKAMKLAPGAVAPGFSLVNLAGETVSLSDFRGKVVYLDFWASWCGPCRREMPHAKKLKERFKGKDVAFVYVSIDDDEAAWRKGVEDMEMEGIQLFSKGFRSETPQAYNVEGIPSYFLINRDGTIARANPSRPSGPSIDDQLNEALNAMPAGDGR